MIDNFAPPNDRSRAPHLSQLLKNRVLGKVTATYVTITSNVGGTKTLFHELVIGVEKVISANLQDGGSESPDFVPRFKLSR